MDKAIEEAVMYGVLFKDLQKLGNMKVRMNFVYLFLLLPKWLNRYKLCRSRWSANGHSIICFNNLEYTPQLWVSAAQQSTY